MKLSELMPLTISRSLITIVHGSEIVYQGLNENLGIKIDKKIFNMKITEISSIMIQVGEKHYPSLYIYFAY